MTLTFLWTVVCVYVCVVRVCKCSYVQHMRTHVNLEAGTSLVALSSYFGDKVSHLFWSSPTWWTGKWAQAFPFSPLPPYTMVTMLKTDYKWVTVSSFDLRAGYLNPGPHERAITSAPNINFLHPFYYSLHLPGLSVLLIKKIQFLGSVHGPLVN